MPTPAYQRIANHIRQQIDSGEFAEYERLPTATELARAWGVSGAVVTQALGVLKAEGLLESSTSKGTYVLPPRKLLTWSLSDFEGSGRTDTYASDDWAASIERQGLTPSSSVTVSRIKASAEIAEWLQLREGETVIARNRVRYADGQPYMVGASYFPKWVAAGTRMEEPGDQSAPGGLLAEADHAQQRARDIITGPVASGDDAGQLRIPAGGKVWQVVRIGYDAADRPIRAMRTTAPLDLWQLEVEHALGGHSESSSPFLTRNFPETPYPGTRPATSFVEIDGAGWVVRPSSGEPSGWVVDVGTSDPLGLDEWLQRRGEPPLRERLPVLAYGSNASPGKVAWLRDQLGLTGPAVVLRAEVEGISAVWSAGTRARDDQRPAVLAGTPGRTEQHSVWMVTPEQRQVLDRCEGRAERHRLAWVKAPTAFANGTERSQVLAYVARPEVIGQEVEQHLNRSPLLVDGATVRVSDVGQEEARALDGVPADSDGLDVVEVHGEPSSPDADASS